MKMKKYMMLCLSIIMLMFMYTTVKPFDIGNTIRWLKQRFSSRPVTRGIELDDTETVQAVPVKSVEHTQREVLFENNIQELFKALKDDPRYADVPNLIDESIIVNGKALAPGSNAEIVIEDGKGVMTIKLRKGFSKLIYAMQQGTLRGILMKLLKSIDPWLEWRYNVTFTVNKDIDFVQLSDLVLAAYNKAQDESAVNHRFKYILVVDLSLNETVDL